MQRNVSGFIGKKKQSIIFKDWISGLYIWREDLRIESISSSPCTSTKGLSTLIWNDANLKRKISPFNIWLNIYSQMPFSYRCKQVRHILACVKPAKKIPSYDERVWKLTSTAQAKNLLLILIDWTQLWQHKMLDIHITDFHASNS